MLNKQEAFLQNVLEKEISVNFANYFSPAPFRNSWGPRIIDDFELILQVEGSSEYFDEIGNNMTILTNELLLIPPGIQHTFKSNVNSKAVISCIHFYPNNKIRNLEIIVYNVRNDYEVRTIFRKMAGEFERREDFSVEIQKILIREVFYRIKRSLNKKNYESDLPAKLLVAEKFIKRNYQNQIDRKRIANTIGVTPEHLNFLFKKYLNKSPLEYLTMLRIEEARKLLRESSLNISEISLRIGYEDPLYFSRIFKKHVGVSPRKYMNSL